MVIDSVPISTRAHITALATPPLPNISDVLPFSDFVPFVSNAFITPTMSVLYPISLPFLFLTVFIAFIFSIIGSTSSMYFIDSTLCGIVMLIPFTFVSLTNVKKAFKSFISNARYTASMFSFRKM
jgi:hypothetical protein